MDRNIRYQVLQEEFDDDENTEEIPSSSAASNNCVRHEEEEEEAEDLSRPLLSSYLQASEASGVGSSNPAVPPEDTSILPPAYEEVSREGQQQQPQQAEYLQQQQQQQQQQLGGQQDLKTNQMPLIGDPGLPPSYAVATDLPSYEEAERLKREEEEEGVHDGGGMLGGGCPVHPHHHHHHHHLRGLTDEEHIHMGGEDGSDQLTSSSDRLNGSGMTVGTDWIFFCTFVMSFLFNWLGFLMSLCITNTVAGRCGALAGLGLSMVKWVAIVKHSGFAGDLAAGESWFWWILMLCGFLLFIRGCMQYVNVKYEWKRITGRLHHFYLF